MSLYSTLEREIDNGLAGKNGSIPFPVAKLDEYLEIAKNTNYLICGDTGSGKSTFAHDLILNILEWYYENLSDDLKLSIIYFGMERKLFQYSAKWASRRLFLEEGIYIPVKKILGRMRKRDPGTGRLTGEYDLMTPEETEKVKFYAKIFKLWEEEDQVLIPFEGTHNATGIKKFIDSFAAKHGELKDRGEGILDKQIYTSYHPNHVVLIVTDYVGVLDEETDKQTGQKKQRLDKYSQGMRKARDVYGFSPINVQQLSRAVSDVNRMKLNDLKPKLSDIADTSELARDADVVLAIFDPYRYIQEGVDRDLLGYHLDKLRDNRGYKYYRSLHILKSSFDGDGISTGAAFYPQLGLIKAMPNIPKNMDDEMYKNIINGTYFLTS